MLYICAMKDKRVWNFRGGLSEETRKKVSLVQGHSMTKGKKITQSEALDFIASKFEIKVVK